MSEQQSTGLFSFFFFLQCLLLLGEVTMQSAPGTSLSICARQVSLLLSERRVGHHILVHVDTTANKSKKPLPLRALTSALPKR